MPPVVPEFLRSLLDRPVAVFGGGVSGDGVCELVRAVGGSAIVYDRKGGAARADFSAADAARHALVVSARESPSSILARRRARRPLLLPGELDYAAQSGRAHPRDHRHQRKTTLTDSYPRPPGRRPSAVAV
jgi:hypothetical protein